MKKEKKVGKIKAFTNELKKTSKGKAILKLIRWAIFFFALFLFCIISSVMVKPTKKVTPSPIKEEEPKEEPVIESMPEVLPKSTLETWQNNLLARVFDYEYTVTLNDKKYVFKGHKDKENDIGYKESPDGIIKYVIDETGVYTETTSGRNPISNLYEGLNTNNLNPINILKEMSTINLNLSHSHNCRNYLYEGEKEGIKYQIEFEEKTKEILYLNISNLNEVYNLSFSNIESD